MTHLDTRDINLRRGGDNIRLVHTSQGNTVDLVGPGNQQQSTVQLLQENNALPSETTSEEDENGARGDGGAEARQHVEVNSSRAARSRRRL